jgi:heme oxygenase
MTKVSELTKDQVIEKMIEYRTNKGFNVDQSKRFLNEILEKDGYNKVILNMTFVYGRFGTRSKIEQYVEVLTKH